MLQHSPAAQRPARVRSRCAGSPASLTMSEMNSLDVSQQALLQLLMVNLRRFRFVMTVLARKFSVRKAGRGCSPHDLDYFNFSQACQDDVCEKACESKLPLGVSASCSACFDAQDQCEKAFCAVCQNDERTAECGDCMSKQCTPAFAACVGAQHTPTLFALRASKRASSRASAGCSVKDLDYLRCSQPCQDEACKKACESKLPEGMSASCGACLDAQEQCERTSCTICKDDQNLSKCEQCLNESCTPAFQICSGAQL